MPSPKLKLSKKRKNKKQKLMRPVPVQNENTPPGPPVQVQPASEQRPDEEPFRRRSSPRVSSRKDIRSTGSLRRAVLTRNQTATLTSTSLTQESRPSTSSYDARSSQGHFGWATIGSTIHVPYVFRKNEPDQDIVPSESQYIPLRIVNQKILTKYFNLFNQEFFDLIPIPAFAITANECRNYNDINVNHCDSIYGLNPFQCNELVMRMDDVRFIHDFLRFMQQRHLLSKDVMHENFGYMMFDTLSHFVPYYKLEGNTYLPLYYFDGDGTHVLNKIKVLPHLCEAVVKVLIRLQNFHIEASPIKFVNFNEIQKYFKVTELYKEGWLPVPNTVFQIIRRPADYGILRFIECDHLTNVEIRYYNWYQFKILSHQNEVPSPKTAVIDCPYATLARRPLGGLIRSYKSS